MKKLLIVLTVLLMTLSSGCKKETTYDTYTYKELSFKLPSNEKVEVDTSIGEGYDFVYDNDNMVIFGISETKQSLAELGYEDISLKDYADLLIDLYEIDVIEKVVENNYVCFSYETGTSADDYYYMVGVYENNTNFWIINYCCLYNTKPVYSVLFKEWVKLVSC